MNMHIKLTKDIVSIIKWKIISHVYQYIFIIRLHHWDILGIINQFSNSLFHIIVRSGFISL